MSNGEVKRSARDGAISVTRGCKDQPEDCVVSVETDGKTQTIVMTEFNARRIAGSLCLMLGLELKASSAKRISF